MMLELARIPVLFNQVIPTTIVGCSNMIQYNY